MRPTIVEISSLRKCRLAFESIAQRYAMWFRASQQVLDIGGKRGVGVDGILDLIAVMPKRIASRVVDADWIYARRVNDVTSS